MRKTKQPKEPSLLSQWFDILKERYLTRKAMRLLVKQEWSIDFLTAMLIRCANHSGRPYEMTISNGHNSIKINTIDTPNNAAYRDDSIFNHLDDDLKVRQFVEGVNKR